MVFQKSVTVRNAQLDQLETTIGTAPILELRSGLPPANCAAAPTGTLLSQFALPSDWLTAASSGSKTKNGTWSGTAVGTGNIAHWRIYESGSPSVCHLQGDAGLTGSPDYSMTVDNPSVTPGQTITVTSFSLTAGNA